MTGVHLPAMSALPLPPGIAREALTVRELPSGEFPRLASVEPFDKLGFPKPETSRVVVGEDAAGRVVAYWCVFAAIHVEPVWIAPEHRSRPGLIRRLWEQVRSVLGASGEKIAFCNIFDEGLPVKEAMAARLGFQKLPGSLYFITVQRDAGAKDL
jgi:hypothetical protein